jgi:hypothetical protein
MIVNETFSIESNKKTISPEQTQYKTIQEKTVDGDKVFTIVAVDDDSGRSLAESIQNLGPVEMRMSLLRNLWSQVQAHLGCGI